MEVARQIAIYIVETTKKIIETLLSDIEDKISFRKMFPKIDLKFDEKKEERNLSLDLFDKSDEYYEYLVEYFNFHLEEFFEKNQKNEKKFSLNDHHLRQYIFQF